MTPAAQRPRSSAVLVWLVALLLGAAVIAHTRFSTDLSAFLPATPDARQRALVDQLKTGIASRTLLMAIGGGDAAQRAAASRALADRLRADAAFEQVLNGDFAAFAAVGRWVFDHRYQLSPAVDAQRFSAAGLGEAIDDTLSLLGTPAGALVKPVLDRDPTGESLRIAEGALARGGPRTQDSVWVSRDGKQALLMSVSRAAGSDLDAQARILSTLRRTFAEVAKPGLELLVSGAPKFAVDSRAQIQREAHLLALTGTVLMGGLLLVAFASLRALAAAMLPAATGVVAGVAAVSLAFGNVHGATLGFGVALLGEAVDYAIYYLIQARRSAADAPGQGWRHWAHESWPTVRLGLMTSVCGFLALAFSGFPGLAQLGVFSIAGLIAAALTTRHVLPVWLPDGTRGVGLRRQLGLGAGALVRTLPRWRHAFSALGVAALALLLWRHDTLWQTELSSLSPLSAQALALDTHLRDELLAGDERTMVAVSGRDVQDVLQRVEAVSQRLDALVRDGGLVGYDAITRFVPSLAMQQRRRAALADEATLRAHLAQATA
ncbi:MAG TPA: MMPL family transporter, partial [Burkholderiaceae bacterium]|nr:MMPL family transporter [Burkholderiaceae bacterium]